MAATLNIQFTDPPDPAATQSSQPIRAALTQAFNEWIRHFDYTTGTYTVNVSFKSAVQPADVSLSGGIFPVSVSGGIADPSFGLAVTGRATPRPDQVTTTLYVNPGYLAGSLSLADLAGPIEREFSHPLGVAAFQRNEVTGSLRIYTDFVYDLSTKFVQPPPNAVTTFNGPNAEAVYGGPVPVLSVDPNITTVGGGAAVDTTVQPANTVQPLDVALLRDAGLPALSDQELGEHQVARLYVAAFGRNADSAGLVQQYGGLRAGRTLAQLGDGIVGSAEFTNRYGGLSNADFVNALYQNVLGRPGDASGVASFNGALASGASRGTILAAFADSDEERGRLNGNPNVTYAATAEAQMARMYDAAFGRDADPVGFSRFVGSVISGTTLQQVAPSFLGSSEFGSRYGAAPSDQALVDALYQNTLHRAPDAAGEAQYVRALASGQFSRSDLLVAFSDSQEHIDLVAQRTGARDAAGANLDLSPHLGVIPVISGPVTA